MKRAEPTLRADYPHLTTIETRWMDNDVYGHVNNVVYYSYFDTVINRFLIERGGLNIHKDAVIGVCVTSQCHYFEPVSFPEVLGAGLRVSKLGKSSIIYEIGLFRDNVERAAAQGHFVHVFVDRSTMRPLTVPENIRAACNALCVSSNS